MAKSNNSMDRTSLMEEYEEIQLKLALASYVEQEGKKLLEENEEMHRNPFFLPTEAERNKFLKRLNRHLAFLQIKKMVRICFIGSKKTALVCSLLLVLLAVSSMTVEAVRVKVFTLFVQLQDEYTEIRLGRQNADEVTGNHLEINWEHAYVPIRIPEDYHIVNVTNLENMKGIEYAHDNGGYILFQQKREGSGTNVDTEDADEVIQTTVQGSQGIIIRKGDKWTVIWQKHSQLFMFMGEHTGLSQNQFLDIAESVTLLQ
ncbi:DUF4367 domain-containing protein [Paenibacillus durus]|uniref:DUF4367 domain-containing protein n=1 Tax=Paenibacillus durus TaxID=44251 RepID=A0A089IY23_PAEDU|nr:DUF4367 domain-containing protein [Paenibacillus durus]AIQ13849.1 hypothetical protein PDUR_19505 [Paenibacillus durus]